MIIPIRCFTCGKVLADKYDYYVSETKKLSNADTGSSKPSAEPQPTMKHFDDIRTGQILDRLGLTRYCCRRHMIAHVDLIEII